MKNDSSNWIMTVGLLAVLAMSVVAFTQLVGLDSKLAAVLVLDDARAHPMQTYTETVQTASGREIVVVTTRQDGESAKDFADRHDAAVAEAKTR